MTFNFSTFDRKPESYRRLDLWNTNKDTINNLLIKSQQSSLWKLYLRINQNTYTSVTINVNTGQEGLNGQSAMIGQERHPLPRWTDLIKGS